MVIDVARGGGEGKQNRRASETNQPARQTEKNSETRSSNNGSSSSNRTKGKGRGKGATQEKKETTDVCACTKERQTDRRHVNRTWALCVCGSGVFVLLSNHQRIDE